MLGFRPAKMVVRAVCGINVSPLKLTRYDFIGSFPAEVLGTSSSPKSELRLWIIAPGHDPEPLSRAEGIPSNNHGEN